MNRKILSLMIGIALTFSASAHAAPLPAPANCLPPPNPADLSVSDVTFAAINASDCYGVVQASSNSASTIGFDGFTPLLVDAVPDGATVTNTVDGVTFTLGVTYLQNPLDQTAGNWSLTWIGGSAPITLDIVAVLQSPSTFVSYLFSDLVLATTPGSGTGTWAINYQFNEDIPILSTFSIYVSGISGATPPAPVDEPASVALLGVAALGLGVLLRRRLARA